MLYCNKKRKTSVRTRKSIVVFMTVFLFVMTLFPGGEALAANKVSDKGSEDAKVDYVKDKDGVRTGINSIELEPFRYYDINGGKSAELNDKLIKEKVLGGKINNDKDKMTIAESWGQVASEFFRSSGKFGSYGGTKEYNAIFGNWKYVPGYDFRHRKNIGKLLGQAEESYTGKYRKDNVRVSGLTKFSAGDKDTLGGLDLLRHEMAKQIGRSYGREKDKGSILSQPTGKNDSALPDMKSRDQSGFYNIVTCLENNTIGPAYYYNAFGIAYYDFEINPVESETLQYISPIEKYRDSHPEDPLEAAARDANSGVEYEEKDDAPSIVRTTNEDPKETASTTSTVSSEESNSFVTSITESKEQSFSEKLGVEVEGKGAFGIAGSSLKVSLDFTMTQAFGTSKTNAEEYSYKRSLSTTLGTPAPPHTQSTDKLQPVTSTLWLPFDCPVVVSFKVMIFGMNGKFTSASVGDSTFGTAGFPHAYVSTIFGGQTDGKSAQENFYRRGVENVSQKGYDRSCGKTDGKFHIVGLGRGTYTQDRIDWKSILDAEKNDPVDPEINYESLRENLGKHAPLLECGSKMKVKGKGFEVTKGIIEPLYPLERIKLTKGKKEYSMAKGDSKDLNDLVVEGQDKDNVPYYGFDSKKGYWELRDENNKPMGKDEKYQAEIVVDPISGEEFVKVHESGKYYLVYMISENAHYTSVNSKKEATNKSIKTAKVTLNVKDSVSKHFSSGDLKIKEKAKVKADDEPLELDHLLNPEVKANDGKRHAVPVTWEVKEQRGMHMDKDGTADFYEPGTYHVRAKYESYKSNWSEITATEPRMLKKVMLIDKSDSDSKDADKGKPEIKVVLKKDKIQKIYLDRYLGFYDQYGDEWVKNVPDISFTVSKEGEGSSDSEINGNSLHVTAPGKYIVKAKAEGFVIDPMIVNVVKESSESKDDNKE